MAIKDSLADLIAENKHLLRDIRESCRKERLWDIVDDTADAEDIIKRLGQRVAAEIDRSDQQTQSLRRDLRGSQQYVQQLQDEATDLRATLGQRDGTIHFLEQQLVDAQQAARTEAKQNYDQGKQEGFAAGQEAVRRPKAPAPSQAASAEEETIIRTLDRAAEAFAGYDFARATARLRQAEKQIHRLPANLRQIYDGPKLHYWLAVSDAYGNNAEEAEASLTTFLNKAGAYNNPEEMLFVAHVQHLLAQIEIGKGGISRALDYCSDADRTRRTHLPPDSNRRHQTTALMARLYELQNDMDAASDLRDSIQPESDRATLREAYGRLKPITDGIAQNQVPFSLAPPVTELLPIFRMKFKTIQKPIPPPQVPPQPRPERTINVPTRDSWLRELSFNPSPATLGPDLKAALLFGNIDLVRSNVQMKQPSIPALHMAALFGDMVIAKLLLDRGLRVNATCRTSSAKAGEHVYGVTPMHLAVGAQHEAMIKLLASRGASFEMPPAPHGKRTAAPALWLVSKRWLGMTGRTDAKSVVDVLKTMKQHGWHVNAGLNQDGDTMLTLAEKNLGDRPELKAAVLKFLGP